MVGTMGLLIGLLILIALSAFFSSAETGMMSINRYRLRHLANKQGGRAKYVIRLLQRPDRLLGIILFGNTFANIMASSIATVLAVQYLGEVGVLVATVVLTLVILIFAEAAPKTYAAMQPQRVAFFAVYALQLLLKIFHPLVFLINAVANGALRLMGVRIQSRAVEPLTAEELRTVVLEASGKIASNHQQMLLRILDLEQATVEDVMVPRTDIDGLDLSQPWEEIVAVLNACSHQYLPIYHDALDQVSGMLCMRKILVPLSQSTLNLETLKQCADPVYFIPDGALAGKQLLNFQQQQQSIGLVVDEYGDIQGLVTLQDILEAIVGGLSGNRFDPMLQIKWQRDGSCLVPGAISIRELNQNTDWALPAEGPKTLSGLMIDQMETIPAVGETAIFLHCTIEVLAVCDNRIEQVRVVPSQTKASNQEGEISP